MKEISIQTSFGNMNAYKSGDGPQPVVLHGGGYDYAMLSWGNVIPLFDERYTVYAHEFIKIVHNVML